MTDLSPITADELRVGLDGLVREASASVVGAAQLAANRTIHFEQDGAYFAFRDRPFYRTAFDAMAEDGMSLGVCASFACKAPMRVRDFDMQAAEQAAAWFVAECARYGFKAERAPTYMDQPEVSEHPACERDDLARCHIDCAEMSIADFATLRAVGAAAPAPAMAPQPCQQQQGQACAPIEAGLVLSLARTATAFHHADEEWGAALRAAFGRRATDARYSALGQGEPGSELRALYVARYQAYAAWSAARSLPVMPDPVAGMLTVKAVA